MQAIFLLCVLLACIIVLVKLSWGVGKLDAQDSTTSNPQIVLHKDPYSSTEWFKDVIKHRTKDNDLNTISEQELVKSKARIQKLLSILRRQPAKDIPDNFGTTNEPTNVQFTTVNCNPVLEENCGPESIGTRLSATLLKILA
ncbi:uncharacterized protein LOC108031004 [Drosophila biarmipes]|uniref:uncharacterized protein LOC108031004 n=1 Tax=Drosophila biarmipes TaxID=125945 RepID=UPI0007E86701|nr:uncharacterized protein LOC108031004 [Drosophila biarmipes]